MIKDKLFFEFSSQLNSIGISSISPMVSLEDQDERMAFRATQVDYLGVNYLRNREFDQEDLSYRQSFNLRLCHGKRRKLEGGYDTVLAEQWAREKQEEFWFDASLEDKFDGGLPKEEKKDESFIDQAPAIDFIEENEEEAAFFRNQWPGEWYPLQKNRKGLIKIVLPKALQQVERLIYIFRNKKKKCFLIGKTGGCLSKRIAKYLTQFNEEGRERRVKKEKSKAFLMDVKKHPNHFAVGILHVLKSEEDLDLFETLSIKHKGKIYKLYNDNKGGGGGSPHSDEALTTYAISKEEAAFSPVKYYPFQRDDQRCIRPLLSPGFKRKIKELKEGLEETQELAYVIKKKDTEERYVGVSIDPSKRSKQHGYAAEYYDPEHKKYDPTVKSGLLHPAMAKSPEKFSIGLLPIRSKGNIDPSELSNYVLLEGIAKVERYAIESKQSHFSANGFNGNYGGGGPIARQATKFVPKRLNF